MRSGGAGRAAVQRWPGPWGRVGWCWVLAGTAVAAAAAEPATMLRWSAAQAEAAGVRTQVVEAPAAAAASVAGMVLQGQVELPPQATQVVGAPLGSVVQEVRVAPGERVAAGQVVARLQSPEVLGLQRELAQAQSQARVAASKLARDEALHAEGIIPTLRLQDSRAQDEQARLAVQERRQVLQALGLAGTGALQPQVLLRAPTAGTVLEVQAVPGQRLEAGMPVARLLRGGRLVVVLQATQAQARELRVGQPLALEGCEAPARLVAIVPQVLAGNQAVQVRAEFRADEDCLRVQQYVRATVAASPQALTRLAVPAQAVVRMGGAAYVFVRRADGFAAQRVELGTAPVGGAWPVRTGLAAGDEIAVAGIAALKGAWQGLGTEGR